MTLNPFKRNKKISLLILLSLISSAYIYSSLTSHSTSPFSPPATPTPPEKIQTTNPILNQLKTPEIIFSPNIGITSFPEKLNVYTTGISEPDDLRSQSQPLVSYFKLPPVPSQNIAWQSTDNNKLLFLDYVGHTIQYSDSSQPKNGASPTISSSISVVKKFLTSISEYSHYSIQEDQIKFYKIQGDGQNYEEIASAIGADYISVPTTLTIDNLPYRDAALNSSPFFILIGKNNLIIKIIYTPQPLPKYSNSKTYSLLTLNQIKEDIKNNKASLISAPINAIPVDLKEVPPITIENISLEYRQDHQKKLLIPYFLLSGVYHLDTADTPESLVQFILPAVHL